MKKSSGSWIEPVEMDRTGNLRIENALHRVQRFALDRLIVHHAGGVNDAGDRPELGANLFKRSCLTRLRVGDIASEDNRLLTPSALIARIRRIRCAPMLSAGRARRTLSHSSLRRQLAACEQREFDLREPRKMLRDLQARYRRDPR